MTPSGSPVGLMETPMSKVTEQDSGVVGGTMDVSRDTTVEAPSDLIDEALARRHEAERRGRNAARRIRELAVHTVVHHNPPHVTHRSS